MIYFTFTQHTAKPIVLGRAVNALLRANVAKTAAWPSDDRVRLAPAMAALDGETAKIKALQALASDTETSFGRKLLSHPILTTELLNILVKGMRKPAAEAAEAAEAADDSDADVADRSLDETMEAIDESLASMQAVSGFERKIEWDLFDGPEQHENHYVRLFLRTTRHRLLIGDRESEVAFEPRLLLHSDGVFQLTVGVHPVGELTTSDLVELSHPGNTFIATSMMPEPLLVPDRLGPGTWALVEGTEERVRIIDHDEPASLYDWIDTLQARVFGVIHATAEGPWNCYPMLITRPGACCVAWYGNHGYDLVRLAARHPSDQGDTFRLDPGPDFSIFTDERRYVSAGSSLHVQDQEWEPGIGDLQLTLIFEYAMLVYTRWRKLENDVIDLRADGPELTRLYRRGLSLSRDARGASIRAGTAKDIVSHLLTQLGAQELERSVDRGLSMLGERASTRSAGRTARAANWIAVLGAGIGLFGALPSIPQTLDLIAREHAANPDAPVWSWIHTLASSPILLVALFAGVCSAYIAVSLITATVRVVRYLLRQRKRGYASHLGVDYEVVSPDEAARQDLKDLKDRDLPDRSAESAR
ncbi:hypothetical protein [Curtobacterium flaccumfaciens]|uniref:hypothetical protein n=1 Tax=Curtobacterium flaccumfaciens TaxID=2035 RepID=UPI00217DFE69|nr:hypothetical protein [Curtobacterium flaccumfaciens]MCS6554626.1 hypothetical protein [Curtobacterium flaccumfaciens]